MHRRNWLLSSLRTCAVAVAANLLVGAGRRIARECVGVSAECLQDYDLVTFHFSDGSRERRRSESLTWSTALLAIRQPQALCHHRRRRQGVER